jgi:mRNA interferase RelE/StbE
MGRPKLRVSRETAELIRSMHPDLKRKIKAALQTILIDPQAGKALKDDLAGFRSFRVGKFRVVYTKSSDRIIIDIVAIGPRRTIYEETLRILRKAKEQETLKTKAR